MSTAIKQDLSLGKLKRAVSSSVSDYTTLSSLGQNGGGGNDIKMSDFSIDSVDSMTGYQYLWESTAEDYILTFSGKGSLFNNKIANVADNFTWTLSTGGASVTNNGATGSIAAAAISNANTGTGDDSDFFPAGTNNINMDVSAKLAEDGQSDGFNDHATNYNTNRTKSIVIVDSYGSPADPSCLLVGTKVDMADGTTKLVEDLEIGDWVLSMNMPGQLDEDEEDWMDEMPDRDVGPVEDLPVGMSLDELKSRGKELPEIDEEQKRERLGGELINEVSEMENDDEVVDETVEEVYESSDDGISVDEYGTEWYEDETGVWWYREAGQEEWSEFQS